MKTFFHIFIALIVGLLIGVSFGMQIPQWGEQAAVQESISKPGAKQGIQTASIMIDFGDNALRVFSDVQFTEGEKLFDVLKRIVEEARIAFEYKMYEGLGVLITEIGEKENSTDGAYWQYWVNNKYAEVGADMYGLNADDTILWKYTTYQGE